MFGRYFVEVPLPADQKDFLDRVGRAITLSQTGGAETMCS
jgi:hypothetical protein